MTGFLFLPPAGIFGHLIGWATHHEPGVPETHHVAVVFGGEDGYFLCGEAWAGVGVRLVRRPKDSGIFIPFEFDGDAAVIWFKKHEGEGYDWSAIPWMGIVGLVGFLGIHLENNPLQSSRRWYCSEAAVAATRTQAAFGSAQITPQRMLNILYQRKGTP